jgi:ABC-type transport system involved in multi-copper enzyme maturation permease subunit
MRITSSPLLWNNPVIMKEVRTRMRGNRAFLLVTAHLLILVTAIALAYLFFRSALTSTGNLEERRIFGKAVFGLIVWIELVMVSFVAPALTSGAITSERERQTLDLLRVTLLPARSLVVGKFISGLFFLFLLLFTSIPILSPAFLIGGVLPQEVCLAIVILSVTTVGFSALGMLLSSLFRHTIQSTAATYAISITLVFGIPIIAVIILILLSTATRSEILNQLSPAGQVILILLGWAIVCLTPFATIIGTEVILLEQESLLLARIPLGSGETFILPSPWIIYLLIYLLFSFAALWLSSELVRRRDQ